MKNRETVKNSATMATSPAFPNLRMSKAFRVLVFFAGQVQKSLKPGSMHSVPMSFLNGVLGFKKSKESTAMILEELATIKLNWATYNKKWSGFSHIVSSCRYDSEEDSVMFSFDPLFIQDYLDKKTPFKNIPLSLVTSFRSNYALKIFELAFQYYDPNRKEGRTPSFSYEALRNLFNIADGTYKNRGSFYEKVLDNPLKEVNALTDYVVKYHDNKRRGVVKRYWFTIKLNPQVKMDFPSMESLDSSDTSDREEIERDSKKRAELFLEFWESEFKSLVKSMTKVENETWVNSLLSEEPTLRIFQEIWLVSSLLKTSEEKKIKYREYKEENGLIDL